MRQNGSLDPDGARTSTSDEGARRGRRVTGRTLLTAGSATCAAGLVAGDGISRGAALLLIGAAVAFAGSVLLWRITSWRVTIPLVGLALIGAIAIGANEPPRPLDRVIVPVASEPAVAAGVSAPATAAAGAARIVGTHNRDETDGPLLLRDARTATDLGLGTPPPTGRNTSM